MRRCFWLGWWFRSSAPGCASRQHSSSAAYLQFPHPLWIKQRESTPARDAEFADPWPRCGPKGRRKMRRCARVAAAAPSVRQTPAIVRTAISPQRRTASKKVSCVRFIVGLPGRFANEPAICKKLTSDPCPVCADSYQNDTGPITTQGTGGVLCWLEPRCRCCHAWRLQGARQSAGFWLASGRRGLQRFGAWLQTRLLAGG